MTRYHFTYTDKELVDLSEAWCNEIITRPNKKMFLETHAVLPKKVSSATPPKFLIVADIGGSFLKLCALKVTIIGDYEYIKQVEKYSMKEHSHSNTSIWVWIANVMKKFMQSLPENEYVGSLTVSYPVKHTSLDTGVILDCGKNFPFDKNTFIGCDPLKSINEACKSKNVNVLFKTIMNDATATAVASYFTDRSTVLGIVLGTGTNGAIVFEKSDTHKHILNSEWASFSSPTVLLTAFDEIVCNNMKENGVYFNLLDVILGGYKIVEICRLFCKYKGLNSSETISLDEMISSISKNNEDRTRREEIIATCFTEMKMRTSQILAALILGTLKALKVAEKHVTVCLNGSIFENQKERMNLHQELMDLFEHIGIQGTYEIKWSFIPDGSLVGCAFSAFI